MKLYYYDTEFIFAARKVTMLSFIAMFLFFIGRGQGFYVYNQVQHQLLTRSVAVSKLLISNYSIRPLFSKFYTKTCLF